MLVIGIVGPKAAGKDTAARYIAKKCAGKSHSHSEILNQILAILNLPNSRENAIKLVALRQKFGPEVLTKALNKKINDEQAQVEVITGIRFDSELANIRSYPNNKIIYIDSPSELRHERQLKRQERFDDTISYEEFIKIEKKETEVHIKELGEKADFKIENVGTEQEFLAKLDAIIKELGIT